MYLCYWMRQSGLADLLPSLSNMVYLGVSAGSIVMTPYNGDADFNLEWLPEGSDVAREGDRALGLVDFTVRVHVDREGFNTSADVENSPPEYRSRPTRSTTNPRSRWSTARSRSSPKGRGRCTVSARADRVDLPAPPPNPRSRFAWDGNACSCCENADDHPARETTQTMAAIREAPPPATRPIR